jgi:hypothetical protein
MSSSRFLITMLAMAGAPVSAKGATIVIIDIIAIKPA